MEGAAMSSMSERILVPFHGEGGGTGELTCRQYSLWVTIQRTGRTLNIGGTMPLPTGSSLRAMVTVLRFLVSRHQSLRTKLRIVDRPDACGAGADHAALEPE